MKKLKDKLFFLEIKEFEVPLQIIVERRNSVRVSLGKNNAILRVPYHVQSTLPDHIRMAKTWLESLTINKPELLDRYSFNKYKKDYKIIILGQDEYALEVTVSDRLDGLVSIEKQTIKIDIPKSLHVFDKRKLARDLISKILVKRYKDKIVDRILKWNNHFFKKSISGVTLRYNNSNWGSCSTSNKINISTRCLLLPLDVLDYIIVHELSHLVEMNHSDRFWKVVENVMPDYLEKEKWLTKHGSTLDF